MDLSSSNSPHCLFQAQRELVSIATSAFNTTEEDESSPVTSVAVSLLGPHSHASRAFEPTLAVPVAKVICGHFVVGFRHSHCRAVLRETKTVVVLAATLTNPIYVPVISTSTAVALSNVAVTQPAATSPVSVSKSVAFAGFPSAAFVHFSDQGKLHSCFFLF